MSVAAGRFLPCFCVGLSVAWTCIHKEATLAIAVSYVPYSFDPVWTLFWVFFLSFGLIPRRNLTSTVDTIRTSGEMFDYVDNDEIFTSREGNRIRGDPYRSAMVLPTKNLTSSLLTLNSQHLNHSLSINFTIFMFGCFFGLASKAIYLSLTRYDGIMVPYAWQIVLLILFHSSEFLFVCEYHPTSCSWHAFLLNNGPLYTACVTGSAIEGRIWSFVLSCIARFLQLRSHCLMNVLSTARAYDLYRTLHNAAVYRFRVAGLCVSILGLVLRGGAFLTAQSSFSHTIATSIRPGSSLVTSGVYRYCRHPGYLGWYLWALG